MNDKMEMLLNNQSPQETPNNSNSLQGFINFKNNFMKRPDFRNAFLENNLNSTQKKILNDLNNSMRRSDKPSPTENDFINEVKFAMESKKGCAKKGEKVVLDKDLKAGLAMKANLLSIFMVIRIK